MLVIINVFGLAASAKACSAHVVAIPQGAAWQKPRLGLRVRRTAWQHGTQVWMPKLSALYIVLTRRRTAPSPLMTRRDPSRRWLTIALRQGKTVNAAKARVWNRVNPLLAPLSAFQRVRTVQWSVLDRLSTVHSRITTNPMDHGWTPFHRAKGQSVWTSSVSANAELRPESAPIA